MNAMLYLLDWHGDDVVELKHWEFDGKIWIHGTPPTRPGNFADRLRWCEQHIGRREQHWITSVSASGFLN
mgnify:FL=1